MAKKKKGGFIGSLFKLAGSVIGILIALMFVFGSANIGFVKDNLPYKAIDSVRYMFSDEQPQHNTSKSNQSGFLEDIIDNFRSKSATINVSEDDKALMDIEFDPKKHPENYVKLNGGKTELNEADNKLLDEKGREKFWAEYNDLDHLGRGQKVTALVTPEAVHAHSSAVTERPSFSSTVKLAGQFKQAHYDKSAQTWREETNAPNPNSNNEIVKSDSLNGYIYNKSHSLGWSLGGDMETHNLTLGTRGQNVGTNGKDGGGMAYTETKVRDVVKNNKDVRIFYEVVPVYKGDELLPRGSHVRVYSVNDNGKTINENVWVFNEQIGFKINHKDGTWEQL